MMLTGDLQEKIVEEGFSRQAPLFDERFGTDAIIRYKRERVRRTVLRYARAGEQMLEINSGTGEDAIYFAKQGLKVHATDLSEGMQDALREKVKRRGLEAMVSYERCSFTQLDELKRRGPYDFIFSNFAGLNCTDQLDKVLLSFD